MLTEEEEQPKPLVAHAIEGRTTPGKTWQVGDEKPGQTPKIQRFHRHLTETYGRLDIEGFQGKKNSLIEPCIIITAKTVAVMGGFNAAQSKGTITTVVVKQEINSQ